MKKKKQKQVREKATGVMLFITGMPCELLVSSILLRDDVLKISRFLTKITLAAEARHEQVHANNQTAASK